MNAIVAIGLGWRELRTFVRRRRTAVLVAAALLVGSVPALWLALRPPLPTILDRAGEQLTILLRGATTPAVRVGNYTQIMRKDGIISGTQDATDNAGGVEQVRYQKLKKAVELRKDVEFSIVTANPSVAGATRQSGSLSTWITSNVSRGATGANGGYNQSTGLTVAPTDGTQRAFTKALMDNVMQQGYQQGANFKYVSMSPYVKSVFVTFMSDNNVASFRYAASDGKNNSIIANADIYEGPFGKVSVVPNRVQAGSAGLARNVFFGNGADRYVDAAR